MEEVVDADKIIVMNRGEIVMEGTPKEIFADVDMLRQYHLDVPQVTLLAHELRKRGMQMPEAVLRVDELVDMIAYNLGR
jgi:energy-coupling factor transport system ATP-binding protein